MLHLGIKNLTIMHEFSITQSLLSIALDRADEAKAGKITGIHLIIGELSSIVEDCVQFYFDFLSQGTIAAEASLFFERIPVQLRCHGCGKVFSPDGLDWSCPECQESQVEIISGRGCYVQSIEVA